MIPKLRLMLLFASMFSAQDNFFLRRKIAYQLFYTDKGLTRVNNQSKNRHFRCSSGGPLKCFNFLSA